MLDSDLAGPYSTEAKFLNRAATRNKGRLPEDFRFRLTREEMDSLRCQIGTLAGQSLSDAGGRTYLPCTYTEQGVAMLSVVLRSPAAIGVCIKIMDAFVEMHRFIADNAHTFDLVREVSRRQIEYQAETNHRLDEMQRSTDERFERASDHMGRTRRPGGRCSSRARSTTHSSFWSRSCSVRSMKSR
jgi:hypothetical protein